MVLSRRQFLAGAGALGGVAALTPAASALAKVAPLSGARLAGSAPTSATLPPPAQAGFDHVVVLCMENRSFDHLLGWMPGANGRQGGLNYPDRAGLLHPTYRLNTFQGCGHQDPDHSYGGARTEYDGGACDGWLKVNDAFSIGYYTQPDLPFLGRAAPAWTVCDNYFAATLGPTFPNRQYLHSARTDRTSNTFTLTSLPTIWDRLMAAGVSANYYFNDLPFLALWGAKYLGISQTFLQFKLAAALGTLPAVSYVDPTLGLELADGLTSDDHPHGDVRNGEAFMNLVYQAVTTSPNWHRTVLVITFDEWGGFFDHVAPTSAPDTNPALTGLRGFRVPCLVISPLASRGVVAHGLYDHTSILKLIEWRWGLAPLTPRDGAANNLAEVLDFASPPQLVAPQWKVDSQFVLPCVLAGTQSLGPGSKTPVPAPAAASSQATGTASATATAQASASTSAQASWSGLRRQAVAHGWSLPTGPAE
ncbi:MAG: phospholipase [Acidimicrobiaceae bacterium]|jgi:phospholipase C|nr:phospholipase [Acidimicrobiaceae bacterium]